MKKNHLYKCIYMFSMTWIYLPVMLHCAESRILHALPRDLNNNDVIKILDVNHDEKTSTALMALMAKGKDPNTRYLLFCDLSNKCAITSKKAIKSDNRSAEYCGSFSHNGKYFCLGLQQLSRDENEFVVFKRYSQLLKLNNIIPSAVLGIIIDYTQERFETDYRMMKRLTYGEHAAAFDTIENVAYIHNNNTMCKIICFPEVNIHEERASTILIKYQEKVQEGVTINSCNWNESRSNDLRYNNCVLSANKRFMAYASKVSGPWMVWDRIENNVVQLQAEDQSYGCGVFYHNVITGLGNDGGSYLTDTLISECAHPDCDRIYNQQGSSMMTIRKNDSICEYRLHEVARYGGRDLLFSDRTSWPNVDYVFFPNLIPLYANEFIARSRQIVPRDLSSKIFMAGSLIAGVNCLFKRNSERCRPCYEPDSDVVVGLHRQPVRKIITKITFNKNYWPSLCKLTVKQCSQCGQENELQNTLESAPFAMIFPNTHEAAQQVSHGCDPDSSVVFRTPLSPITQAADLIPASEVIAFQNGRRNSFSFFRKFLLPITIGAWALSASYILHMKSKRNTWC